MPFAGYKDFAECVAKNADKADPNAYCATIERAVTKAAGGTAKKAAKKMPADQMESDFGEADVPSIEFREAVILLDKAARPAKVVQIPDGDTIVFPEYDGAFSPAEMPKMTSVMDFDLEDATRALGMLARIRQHEKDEPDEAAALTSAIDALVTYIQAEATEEGCDECGHAMECDCTTCSCDEHGAVEEAAAIVEALRNVADDERFALALEEAGRRNSARDAATLRQIIALVKSLGIDEEEAKKALAAADEEVEPVAEAHVDESTPAEALTFREAGAYGDYVTLSEASPQFDEKERVVWITPIKPGWGNSRDNNYYPTETLKEATESGKFNHLKMFKDHPRKSDEKDLPERSVKDWFATTREAVWDEVRQKPRVPIKVHDDADFRRMQEAPEQVAFSVLGGGMARPGEVGGRKGRIVEAISKMRSVDWVTEAGAGGGIDFAESASSEELDMDIENLTPEQLAEGNPGLYAHLVGLGKALASVDREEASTARAAAKADKAGAESTEDAEAAGKVKESDEAPAWAQAIVERLDRIESRESAAETAQKAEASKAEAAKVVKATIDATTLPKTAKDAVAARFTEAAIGDDQTEDQLKEAVEAAIAEAEAIIAPFMKKGAPVVGLGATADDAAPMSVREAAEAKFSEKFGQPTMPRKDQTVFSAEQLGDPKAAATMSTDEGEAAPVSEAASGVADRIAAKF